MDEQNNLNEEETLQASQEEQNGQPENIENTVSAVNEEFEQSEKSEAEATEATEAPEENSYIPQPEAERTEGYTEIPAEPQQTKNENDTTAKGYSGGEQSAPVKSNKSKKVLAACVAVALIVALLAFSAAFLNYAIEDDEKSDSTSSVVEQTSREYENSGKIKVEETAAEVISEISELYESCAPSCCTIYIPTSSGYYLGSGFVVDADNGYIVTNHHVIEDAGNNGIQVIFYDGDKYEATLVGSDELTDIAVLKIEAEGLVALPIGDSSKLKVGEYVMAIGTPYSLELAGTLTVGAISGVDREIGLTNSSGKVVKTMKLIQTNADINPGNSGGALINLQGQVVGITNMKLVNDYDGIGFAIPMSSAVTVINNLIDYGEVVDETDLVKAAARLNVTVSQLSPNNESLREYYSLPEDLPEGVLIIEMGRNTNIYKAGGETYDIITTFAGVRTETYEDLKNELANHKAGDVVTVTVYRMKRSGDGEYVDITFALEAAE